MPNPARRPRALQRMLAPLLLLAACCGAPSPALAQGYICAEGGGGFASGAWAEPVIKWMVEKGGAGAVVILGAPAVPEPDAAEPALVPDPAPAPDPAQPDPAQPAPDPLSKRFLDAGAAGVVDLRIGPAEADKPEIAAQISAARIIFIRGGSQTKYVNAWRGKRTEAAIRAVFKAGGVVGGTSAGCAVLGEVIYDAQHGSLASRDILRDARHKELTLATGFLELTPGVIFDTHFTERGRLPRLAVMLARAKADLKRDLLGIGVDARAALCISPDGAAEVLGQGSVTLLNLTPASRLGLQPGAAPVVTEIAYTQLVEGYRYDLRKREVTARPDHARRIEHDAGARLAPVLRVARAIGHDAESAPGELRVDDGGDADALRNGRLRAAGGDGAWGFCVTQTRTFDDRPFLENRVGGVQWLLAERAGWLGVYLTTGCDADIDESSNIVARLPDDEEARKTPSSMLLLDTDRARSTAQTLAITGDLSEGARQSVAIEGATLHIIAPSWAFSPVPAGVEGDGQRARVLAPSERARR